MYTSGVVKTISDFTILYTLEPYGYLRGELMQHKGLIKSKLPSQISLEIPPSWPVLPPPLKGLELPESGDPSDATRIFVFSATATTK